MRAHGGQQLLTFVDHLDVPLSKAGFTSMAEVVDSHADLTMYHQGSVLELIYTVCMELQSFVNIS